MTLDCFYRFTKGLKSYVFQLYFTVSYEGNYVPWRYLGIWRLKKKNFGIYPSQGVYLKSLMETSLLVIKLNRLINSINSELLLSPDYCLTVRHWLLPAKETFWLVAVNLGLSNGMLNYCWIKCILSDKSFSKRNWEGQQRQWWGRYLGAEQRESRIRNQNAQV